MSHDHAAQAVEALRWYTQHPDCYVLPPRAAWAYYLHLGGRRMKYKIFRQGFELYRAKRDEAQVVDSEVLKS